MASEKTSLTVRAGEGPAYTSSASTDTAVRERRASRLSFLDEEDELLTMTQRTSMTEESQQRSREEYVRGLELSVGLVILGNVACVWVESDLRAVDQAPPGWMRFVNLGFLAVYVIEATAHMYVERWSFPTDPWNLFSVFVILFGVAGEMLYYFVGQGIVDSQLGVVRAMRSLQVIRTVRLFSAFRELWLLARNVASTLRTLFWSVLLFSIVVAILAILCVSMLHPVVATVPKERCDLCHWMFSSVLAAMLTLFEITSGEDSGPMFNEVVKTYPWVAGLVMPMICLLSFCMTNLIVTVIVENAAQARELDAEHFAQQQELQYRRAASQLREIFDAVDRDGNGCLSYQEVERAVRKNKLFQTLLDSLNISRCDVGPLFELVDQDGSGEISADEFCEQIYLMRSQDEGTTLAFLIHMVQTIAAKQREIEELTRQVLAMAELELEAELRGGPAGPLASPARGGPGREAWAAAAPLQEPWEPPGPARFGEEGDAPCWPLVLPPPRPSLWERSARAEGLQRKAFSRP